MVVSIDVIRPDFEFVRTIIILRDRYIKGMFSESSPLHDMKVEWSESTGLPLPYMDENVGIYYSSILRNPSGRVWECAQMRKLRLKVDSRYVYSAARGRRSRKVLKIYKFVYIKPKRSPTKDWCEWVRIFDKV